MKRILIIGCGGAGKTHLAFHLGRILNLPVHHLDRLYWKPGWEPSSGEEMDIAVKNVMSNDAWIMDGNYGGTMEMRMDFADAIIFLDMPTITCVLGVITRYFKYRAGSRPDMTDGNHERIPLDFLSWILSYRRNRRPKILSLLDDHRGNKDVIILHGRKSVGSFLEQLEKDANSMPTGNDESSR